MLEAQGEEKRKERWNATWSAPLASGSSQGRRDGTERVNWQETDSPD